MSQHQEQQPNIQQLITNPPTPAEQIVSPTSTTLLFNNSQSNDSQNGQQLPPQQQVHPNEGEVTPTSATNRHLQAAILAIVRVSPNSHQVLESNLAQRAKTPTAFHISANIFENQFSTSTSTVSNQTGSQSPLPSPVLNPQVTLEGTTVGEPSTPASRSPTVSFNGVVPSISS